MATKFSFLRICNSNSFSLDKMTFIQLNTNLSGTLVIDQFLLEPFYIAACFGTSVNDYCRSSIPRPPAHEEPAS